MAYVNIPANGPKHVLPPWNDEVRKAMDSLQMQRNALSLVATLTPEGPAQKALWDACGQLDYAIAALESAV